MTALLNETNQPSVAIQELAAENRHHPSLWLVSDSGERLLEVTPEMTSAIMAKDIEQLYSLIKEAVHNCESNIAERLFEIFGGFERMMQRHPQADECMTTIKRYRGYGFSDKKIRSMLSLVRNVPNEMIDKLMSQ